MKMPMQMKEYKQRISDLEDELLRAQLRLKRYEEAEEPAPVSRINLPDVAPLPRFKDHCNEIEHDILSSQYLSSARKSALAEIRFQVIHCPTYESLITHEKKLMRSKAATAPSTVLGSLAAEISRRAILAARQDNQLTLFNAVFELALMECDPEIDKRGIRDFSEYLIGYDGNSLLGACDNTYETLVELRKAKLSGSLEKISAVIEEIIEVSESE